MIRFSLGYYFFYLRYHDDISIHLTTGLLTDSMTEEERNNLERFLKGYEQELERNQSKDLEPSFGPSLEPSFGPSLEPSLGPSLGPLGASSSSPPSLSILMGRIGRAHVQVKFLSFITYFTIISHSLIIFIDSFCLSFHLNLQI